MRGGEGTKAQCMAKGKGDGTKNRRNNVNSGSKQACGGPGD